MPVDHQGPPAGGPVPIVLGVGASRGCPPRELLDLVDGALAVAGAGRDRVVLVASADVKDDEPAILELAATLCVPTRFFPAGELAAVPVPTPSAVVAGHVGTPSVAEASALLAAGETTRDRGGRPDRDGTTDEAVSAQDPADSRSAGPARLLVPKRRSAHATCALATSAPAPARSPVPADPAPDRSPAPTDPAPDRSPAPTDPAPDRPRTQNEVPLP